MTKVAVQESGMTRVMAGVGATPSTTDSATAMLSSRRPSSMRSSPTKELFLGARAGAQEIGWVGDGWMRQQHGKI